MRKNAYMLGTIILDRCPTCGRKVEKQDGQELRYWPENQAFGRLCLECKEQEGKVCLAGPLRVR